MLYCEFLGLHEEDCPEELIGIEFTYYSVNENTIWANAEDTRGSRC